MHFRTKLTLQSIVAHVVRDHSTTDGLYLNKLATRTAMIRQLLLKMLLMTLCYLHVGCVSVRTLQTAPREKKRPT